MSTKTFDKLYTLTKSGKIKEWQIKVEENEGFSTILSATGFLGMKSTVYKSDVKSGKNIGKINATTHFSQAVSDANSKFDKKIDQGYTTSETGVSNSKKILPMLALDYNKRGHDITFPCYAQSKIDGVRAITYGGGIHSRKGNEFTVLDHIVDEVKKLGKDINLDGELYSEGLGFQVITGIIRKKKLSIKDLKILKEVKFVVYDIVSDEGYSKRLNTLSSIFSKHKFKYIELHPTETIGDASQVEYFHDKYVSDGYEGLILRNFSGGYEEKNRSKNLQKFKKFMDAEFEIVDFTEGSGVEEGAVLWVCKIPGNGLTFTARPVGSHLSRQKLFKKGKKYIGKLLTVKYFEMTEDGVPRFPVGMSIRDYE